MPTLNQVVKSNDLNTIQRFSDTELMAYFHPKNGKTFLDAITHCSTATVRYLCDKLKHNLSPASFNQMLKAKDAQGRDIIQIAIDTHDHELLAYLNQTFGFELRGTDVDRAIAMNSFYALEYLINDGLRLSTAQRFALRNPESRFLAIVHSNNYAIFQIAYRSIKALTIRQSDYTRVVDNEGKNALVLAASLGHDRRIIRELLTLNFDLTATDFSGRTLLFYLITNNYPNDLIEAVLKQMPRLSEVDAKILSNNKDRFPMQSAVDRQNIGRLVTHQPTTTHEGRVPRARPVEVMRPPRSFNGDRERQLLKHAATQLYLAVASTLPSIKDFKEIQIMHQQVGLKHFLFVAINEAPFMQNIIDYIKDKSFRGALMGGYALPRDAESAVRSPRYAAKLKARVFAPDGIAPSPSNRLHDALQTRQVASLLRRSNLFSYTVNDAEGLKKTARNIFNNGEPGIYLMYSKHRAWNGRHAEELLVDIATCANVLAAEQGVISYNCISGKKRPCMGCYGRMQTQVDRFGEYPGRFWLNSLSYQSPEAAQRTLTALLSKPAHNTLGANGKELTNYDSESDSEVEDNIVYPAP